VVRGVLCVWCGVVCYVVCGMWCGVLWCVVCGVVWFVVCCGVVCDVVWCGVVWCGVVCGVVCRYRHCHGLTPCPKALLCDYRHIYKP
jgi:hypothetical protein